MQSFNMIKRFTPYYKKYWGVLILDLICATLTIVCEMTFPLIIRYITDVATTDLQSLTLQIIFLMGILYISLRLIEIFANYFMQNMGHVMGAKMETDMRNDLFIHLETLSFTYYNNTKIGQLMSRMTSDLFEVTEFAHHCPEEFFIAILKIVFSFAILATFNIWLTLILFAMIPLLLLSTIYFSKKMRDAFKHQRHEIGEINSQVEDSLLGIRVVKAFNNEDVEAQKFEKGNDKFLSVKKNVYRYMAGFHSVTRLFDGLMYSITIIIGSIFLINHTISIGDFTAFLLYVTTLLSTIRRIVEFAEQFQRGITGVDRFFEILDVQPDIIDKPDAIHLEKAIGNVIFNNVSFSYGENNQNVLQNINIDIKAGERIAIVGPSGGGKTTLCNLLPRFYSITGGEITLDGINICDFTLKSLRENMCIVQQDVYLFSGTIYENIIYGDKNATKEAVIESAKNAGAHEFISSLPKGYDTYVGERGVKLSGGQKQRISIARVFLKNPPILMLDEATSALDNESEKIIQNSIEKLSVDRTTITIAHRLTTIKNADRILVLTKDGIVEEGTHTDLMNKKGIYYNMNSIIN